MVCVVQFCGESVQGTIPAIRRFRVAERRKTSFEAGLPLQGHDGVDATARNLSLDVDEVITLLSYWTLENLGDDISSKSLYGLHGERSELVKFCFQKGRLRLVFDTFLESVTKVSNIVRPRPPPVEVTVLDKVGSVMRRPDSHPALASFYRNRSRIFSTSVGAKPKLSMKQFWSEKKGSMHM